nr:hypothetical protein [Tanacetum cinerariifolium]
MDEMDKEGPVRIGIILAMKYPLLERIEFEPDDHFDHFDPFDQFDYFDQEKHQLRYSSGGYPSDSAMLISSTEGFENLMALVLSSNVMCTIISRELFDFDVILIFNSFEERDNGFRLGYAVSSLMDTAY